MLKLITYKTIETFPDVRVWRTGHLKIEVMEILGGRCYILPPSINFGCYDNGGITYHRLHTSVGRRGYINSSNFHNVGELVVRYREQLQFQQERSLANDGNGLIPLISRPSYMRHGDLHELSAETLSEGFSTLEEALVWVDALSLRLVRCSYLKGYYPDTKDILYYGRVLYKLYCLNGGDQYVADRLGISVSTARTMRTEAKVPYKHRNKIKLLDIWS